MIDFATLQGLTIPEGVVSEIKDASGRVIWAVQSGDKVVLEVEKITSDTYAGETTYTGESFILLDIYPKTNGTVSVTYGGLTKTITDTSGAEEPNAQQVYFGTFNGVADSVETPASGELTIEGDYYAFGSASFSTSKITSSIHNGINKVSSFGNVIKIPENAFNGNPSIEQIELPKSVKTIGARAFAYCDKLASVFISAGVESISEEAFASGVSQNNILTVDGANTAYKIDGDALIEIATGTLIAGFINTSIPTYITRIGSRAFQYSSPKSVIIPAGVTSIGDYGFSFNNNLENVTFLGTTPPTLGLSALKNVYDESAYKYSCSCTITVPAGCGEAYKAAEGWSEYASQITEAS